MTPRSRFDPDDPEMIGQRQSGDLPLFADSEASQAAGREGLERSASKHEADIERLVPLALELARKAPEITVANLRIVAVQRGLLTGEERGRELSWLPAVMVRAGLEPTGRYVRSPVVKSHGNLHQSWRLPTQGEGAA